jgi:hypothetical protein
MLNPSSAIVTFGTAISDGHHSAFLGPTRECKHEVRSAAVNLLDQKRDAKNAAEPAIYLGSKLRNVFFKTVLLFDVF